MPDWVPEPRPVDPALTTEFHAEPFLVPVLEKLDAATRDDLLRLLGGWPVES